MRLKGSSAFTLVELLVVLVIIGILISFVYRWVVSTAAQRAQWSIILNNGRQLHIATQSLEIDNLAAGKLSGWPGVSGKSVSTSVDAWTSALVKGGYLTGEELKKLLSAPGKVQSGTNNFAASAIAFHVYQVGNVKDDTTIFLSTANWDAANPKKLDEVDLPYGKKGFAIIRKGGDGAPFANQFASYPKATNVLTSGTQPPKLP